MTLKEARVEFSRLVAEFILEARRRGYQPALAEGGLSSLRKVSLTPSGPKTQAFDRVHMLGSLHYDKLAQDLDLYDANGRYIDQTSDPAWQELGKWWLEQSVYCRWGGDWNENGKTDPGDTDGNHISFNPFDSRG